MKPIYKICTIAGLAAVLATTTLHASFDESMYAAPSVTWQLFGDGGSTSSGYYEPVTSRLVVSSPNDPGLATPNGIGALVPEPTTIIAGALLLLPFGVSAIRILRQRTLK